MTNPILVELCSGLPLDPLPDPKDRDPDVPHAPIRNHGLSDEEKEVQCDFKNVTVFFLILNKHLCVACLEECSEVFPYRSAQHFGSRICY